MQAVITWKVPSYTATRTPPILLRLVHQTKTTSFVKEEGSVFYKTETKVRKTAMSETVIIKESRGKNIRLLLLMLGAAVLCTWAVTTPETTFQPHKRHMTIVLSAIALPFLAAGIGMVLGRLVRPRPLLVLTTEGFEFSPGFRNSRFIPWHEVSDISLIKIRSVKILCAALRHREKYLASLPKAYRWLTRINRSLGYSWPIQINTGMAKGYTTEEIVSMMYRYRAKQQDK